LIKNHRLRDINFHSFKTSKPLFQICKSNLRYTDFGGAVPYRPVEDIAYSVARFIQKGGSLVNYYMYHGGTNFDRTAGEFMASSYDYDAPLDEYGTKPNSKDIINISE
jgi:hypothetical protein